MRVYETYWLDYDSVAVAVLVISISIMELIVFSISRSDVPLIPNARHDNHLVPCGCVSQRT
jgi:hypothetical protein